MPEKSFFDTRVGRLGVTVAGEGAPAVLWHSLFADERSWGRLTPSLAHERRLIIITGPGHGDSGDPGRRYTLLDCAGAATEVLDEMGLVEPSDWIGNAWGGHVGLRFATAFPRRIRTLVTLGTPLQALSTAERTHVRVLLQAYRWIGASRFIADAVVGTMLSTQTRASDPEAVTLLRSSFVEADPRRLRNAVVSVSLGREDLMALLPDVAVPTLIVTGAQHSGWTPDQAAKAAAELPDGRVAVVPDAAYLVPLEQPDLVLTLIRDFWATTQTDAPAGPR